MQDRTEHTHWLDTGSGPGAEVPALPPRGSRRDRLLSFAYAADDRTEYLRNAYEREAQRLREECDKIRQNIGEAVREGVHIDGGACELLDCVETYLLATLALLRKVYEQEEAS